MCRSGVIGRLIDNKLNNNNNNNDIDLYSVKKKLELPVDGGNTEVVNIKDKNLDVKIKIKKL
jgi:hypothetical protein